MKCVVQRVLDAKCIVEGNITGKIDKGFLVLVGFTIGDTIDDVKKMARKIQGLRIFEDENYKMNLSLKDIGGKILSISQFTLYADASHGYRPSFTEALKGELAKPLYDEFNKVLKNEYNLEVETGIFGADMKLEFINSGPVTIILDSISL